MRACGVLLWRRYSTLLSIISFERIAVKFSTRNEYCRADSRVETCTGCKWWSFSYYLLRHRTTLSPHGHAIVDIKQSYKRKRRLIDTWIVPFLVTALERQYLLCDDIFLSFLLITFGYLRQVLIDYQHNIHMHCYLHYTTTDLGTWYFRKSPSAASKTTCIKPALISNPDDITCT